MAALIRAASSIDGIITGDLAPSEFGLGSERTFSEPIFIRITLELQSLFERA
jgi:hypothetical protein